MITCKFCSKETPTIHHQIRCSSNPNRKGITPVNYWTDEKRIATKLKSIETNTAYWTDERRKEQSIRMQQVVANNPESYSKNNVSGRVKMCEVMSSVGITKVKGKWELAVANYLNNNNINWTNDITPYSYYWNNGWHLYFPEIGRAHV